MNNSLIFGFLLTFLSTNPALTYAALIDNGVAGIPIVACGPNSLKISFLTKNKFEGRLFVKNQFTDPHCRSDGTGFNSADIDLPFKTCGINRLRSANPPGIFVSTTVVITFHPNFISKVDRAYMIQCFYMETDKIVFAQLQVGMLTTQFQTESVPMPSCKYEVLSSGIDGTPVNFVQVGQQVYHKWTCLSDYADTFCMTVHSCKVDDGTGDSALLIDQNGCAVDPHLLTNLEYVTDLMVGQESHVFKYADKANLYFDCQISIAIKEPYESCIRPNCPALPLRGKRHVNEMYPFNSTDMLLKQSTDRAEESSSHNYTTCHSGNSFLLFLVINVSLLSASCVFLYLSFENSQKT